MPPFERSHTVAAADFVLARGGWCALEVCLDVPRQRWEQQLVICESDPEAVADAFSVEVERQPGRDARMVGCNRRTLRLAPAMGAKLCYLAPAPVLAEAGAT